MLIYSRLFERSAFGLITVLGSAEYRFAGSIQFPRNPVFQTPQKPQIADDTPRLSSMTQHLESDALKIITL